MRHLTYRRFLTALLLAAASIPAWAGPTLQFAAADGVVRMPFTFDNNHIFVKATLKGGKSGSFIIESGADFTVLNARFATAAGVTSSGQSSIHTAGGSTSMSYAKTQVLVLPGLEITDDSIGVMDLSNLEPIGGWRIDGLIGNDILHEFTVRIDYAARMLTLYRPDVYKLPSGAVSLPMSEQNFTDNVFVPVSLTLPGHTPEVISCAIDTGASYSGLNTPYVDSSGAIKAVGTTVERRSYGAGSAQVDSLMGRVSGLQLGPYLLTKPVLSLSRSKNGVFAQDSFQGVLGNDVFKRFTLTLDYADHKLVLEPNADFNTPFRTDASGLSLMAQGDDLRSYAVMAVAPGSPAEAAGLKVGDVIQQVDGGDASHYTLGELKQLFTQD
ncbi:MAG: aspartyl protease family protein, partial [Mycobacterium sp.]